MQPTYLPWLGYFAMIDAVDIFVFLDTVQLSRQSWQTRNRIKTSSGELILSVPVQKSEDYKTLLICDAKTDEKKQWRQKHLRSIEQAYRKAAHFDKVAPFMEEFFSEKSESLSGINTSFISSVCKRLGLETPLLRTSEMTGLCGGKDELLASICQTIGADSYLSAKGSALYIESESEGGAFAKNGLSLGYQNYEHPKYTQLYGEFLPYMSVVDILFNEGFETALQIIRSGDKTPLSSAKVAVSHCN